MLPIKSLHLPPLKVEKAWHGIAILQVSPFLSSSTLVVSYKALNFIKSVVSTNSTTLAKIIRIQVVCPKSNISNQITLNFYSAAFVIDEL